MNPSRKTKTFVGSDEYIEYCYQGLIDASNRGAALGLALRSRISA